VCCTLECALSQGSCAQAQVRSSLGHDCGGALERLASELDPRAAMLSNGLLSPISTRILASINIYIYTFLVLLAHVT
jgi:hypothetical protein